MYAWVDDAIAQATEYLITSAGFDQPNDHYLRGVIATLRDLKNKTFLENGATE